MIKCLTLGPHVFPGIKLKFVLAYMYTHTHTHTHTHTLKGLKRLPGGICKRHLRESIGMDEKHLVSSSVTALGGFSLTHTCSLTPITICLFVSTNTHTETHTLTHTPHYRARQQMLGRFQREDKQKDEKRVKERGSRIETMDSF